MNIGDVHSLYSCIFSLPLSSSLHAIRFLKTVQRSKKYTRKFMAVYSLPINTLTFFDETFPTHHCSCCFVKHPRKVSREQQQKFYLQSSLKNKTISVGNSVYRFKIKHFEGVLVCMGVKIYTVV